MMPTPPAITAPNAITPVTCAGAAPPVLVFVAELTELEILLSTLLILEARLDVREEASDLSDDAGRLLAPKTLVFQVLFVIGKGEKIPLAVASDFNDEASVASPISLWKMASMSPLRAERA